MREQGLKNISTKMMFPSPVSFRQNQLQSQLRLVLSASLDLFSLNINNSNGVLNDEKYF